MLRFQRINQVAGWAVSVFHSISTFFQWVHSLLILRTCSREFHFSHGEFRMSIIVQQNLDYPDYSWNIDARTSEFSKSKVSFLFSFLYILQLERPVVSLNIAKVDFIYPKHLWNMQFSRTNYEIYPIPLSILVNFSYMRIYRKKK